MEQFTSVAEPFPLAEDAFPSEREKQALDGLVEINVPDEVDEKELNFTLDKKWHVEIPWYKTAIKGKNSFTVFTLRVFYGDCKWTIDRRFSDCFQFCEDLHRRYEGVPEFPTRQPKFLHDPKFLQTRQRELESYFQKFDQAAYATEEMRNFLGAFTELKKRGIHDIRPENTRLKEIVPGTIFCATGTVALLNGILLPVRMTVIKLQGGLLIYSPIKYDDALHMELEELGPVKYIIAPNKMHHLFLPEYLEKFPEVRLYIAPGVKVPDYDKGVVLRSQPEEEWAEEVDQVLTAGNSFFSEAVLFHKKTGVLLVADLILNFPPNYFDPQMNADGFTAISTQFFLETPDKPMCSSDHTTYCTDVKAFEAVCNKILAWNFQSIIVCHGDIITESHKATDAFTTATNAVIKKVKERWGVTNTVFSLFGSKK